MGKKNLSDKHIYVTSDYSIFKPLSGNRDVLPGRVKKIKDSINAVGYITSPIIVNKNFEIIDGQGRKQALQELHLPIEYIIEPEAGVKECVHMNIQQSNWTPLDFIKSYAVQGKPAYVILTDLMNKYPDIPYHIIAYGLVGTAARHDKGLISGQFTINNGDKAKTIAAIENLRKYNPYKHKITDNGHWREFCHAMFWAFAAKSINPEVMLDKFDKCTKNKFIEDECGFYTIAQALESLEKIYNRHRNRADRVYIMESWRRLSDQGKAWWEMANV